MSEDRQKKELRKEKRAIKRAGVKHRRRAGKRVLREQPEEAAFVQDSVGRYRSDKFNGMDQDSTRRKPSEPNDPTI